MRNSTGELPPQNTAVVLIEFQKTWTEKGLFYRLIKKEYNSRKVLNNTLNLLSAARKHGYAIIQAPFIIDKNDKKRYKQIPFLPKALKRFTKGTWKAEFTDGIYQKSDIVIEGRIAFDACEGSNLEEILNKNKIKSLLFCGFTTDQCVELTMKTLISKGYDCILVSDCTATLNHSIQKKVEKRNRTMTSAEAIEFFKTHNTANSDRT